MQRKPNRWKIALLSVSLILLLASPAAWAQQENQPAEKPTKGLHQRIDFSTAHIMGQSIKSGAVYLMHRKKSDIKNMLQVRENYREEIMEDHGLENTAIAHGGTEQAQDQRK